MANTRREPPEKISADCPHCGFSQLESAFAKSTFCRKCGEHYSIEKLLAKETGSLKAPGLFERLGKMISRETIREISCFSCAATQQVSSAAESSLCPKCGSYIDLRDFKITGPFGRSIQTQGEVSISSKGDLTSQRVLCGGARIEGKMRGQMVCTGDVAIRMQGPLIGGVEATTVVIEKKSDVDLGKPVQAQTVEINGKARGVVICAGRVTINKSGSLEGAIFARSIVIEKGGVFSGELHIGADEETAGSEPIAPEIVTPAVASQVAASEKTDEPEISDQDEAVEEEAVGGDGEAEAEGDEEDVHNTQEEPVETVEPPEDPAPGAAAHSRSGSR
ncbi:MAG: polymer-forming cytoskeletal protein [Verrucomicrobiaceae bacterium]|nr:MAG: polymer-forming cytoskeletal protein [Verrucomicrobiaceae bacterium]